MNEEIKAYLQEIGRKGGSSTSEKKRAASALNAQKAGRPSLAIELIPCTCGGQGQDVDSHRATCPRGRAIRRRNGV